MAQHNTLRPGAGCGQRNSEAMLPREFSTHTHRADENRSEPVELNGRENQNVSLTTLLPALCGVEVDVEDVAAFGDSPLQSNSLPTGPESSQDRSLLRGLRSDGRHCASSSVNV